MTRLTPEQIAERHARIMYDAAPYWMCGRKYTYDEWAKIYSSAAIRLATQAAALLSHIEADVWQTMETAPRDENVLLATSGGWVGEARFELMHDQTWDWIWASGSIVHEQHKKLGWRPLPAPPETKE